MFGHSQNLLPNFRLIGAVFCVFAACLLSACSQESSVADRAPRSIIISKNAININEATLEELEGLPNIGAKTALEIIRHREKFGRFRRSEHLMLINRMSDKRFREIRHMIKTE